VHQRINEIRQKDAFERAESLRIAQEHPIAWPADTVQQSAKLVDPSSPDLLSQADQHASNRATPALAPAKAGSIETFEGSSEKSFKQLQFAAGVSTSKEMLVDVDSNRIPCLSI